MNRLSRRKFLLSSGAALAAGHCKENFLWYSSFELYGLIKMQVQKK